MKRMAYNVMYNEQIIFLLEQTIKERQKNVFMLEVLVKHVYSKELSKKKFSLTLPIWFKEKKKQNTGVDCEKSGNFKNLLFLSKHLIFY